MLLERELRGEEAGQRRGRNLRLAVSAAKPRMDEALNSYDDLLQDIINSQQYKN